MADLDKAVADSVTSADTKWSKWHVPKAVLLAWERRIMLLPISSSIAPIGHRRIFTKPNRMRLASSVFIWAYAMPLTLSSVRISENVHRIVRRCVLLFSSICRIVLQRELTPADLVEVVVALSFHDVIIVKL